MVNTLITKATENINIILDMDENETFISKRGKLVPQDEFVQVNNIIDLEYAIYFTYHQLINDSNKNDFYNGDLFKKLDDSIDNLYNNKQFNEIISNDEEFKDLINDIDLKISHLKDIYYYQSPFFQFFKKSYNLMLFFQNILKENNKYISKVLKVTNNQMFLGCSFDNIINFSICNFLEIFKVYFKNAIWMACCTIDVFKS